MRAYEYVYKLIEKNSREATDYMEETSRDLRERETRGHGIGTGKESSHSTIDKQTV